MKKLCSVFAFLSYLIIVQLCFISCKTKNIDPIPDFSYKLLSDGKVEFINNSSNALSYIWNFGDGSSKSIEVNPTHTYKYNGEYTITLTVKNDEKELLSSKKISISNGIKPTARFTVNILKDGYIELTNESDNAESYSWDLGDGNYTSDASPKNHYISNGNYNIKLKAINRNGFDEITQSIKITDAIDENDYYVIFKGNILNKPVQYIKNVKSCTLDYYSSSCITQGGRDYAQLRFTNSSAGFETNDNNFFQFFNVTTKKIYVDTYNTIKVGEVKLAQSFPDTTAYSLYYGNRDLTKSNSSVECYSDNGNQDDSKLTVKSKKYIRSIYGKELNILVKLEVKCNMYDRNNTYVGKIEGEMQIIFANYKQIYK